MILKYFGIKVELNELKEKVKLKGDGVSAYEIVKTAAKYNVSCIGYKNVELESLKLPAIIHTVNSDGIGHYVVLIKVLKDKLLIADPLVKIMYVDKDKFLKTYSKIALIFEKKYNFLKILTNNKGLIFKIILYTLTIVLFNLLFSYSISTILSKRINHNYEYIIIYILTVSILKVLFSYIKSIYSLKFRTSLDEMITIPIISRLLKLPYEYYQNNGSGALLSKITDLSYIKDMIVKTIEIVLINVIFILSSVLLLHSNIKFIFLNIVYIIVMIIINKRKLKYQLCDFYDLQIKNQNLNNKIIDYFNSILSIKNVSKESYYEEKLSKTYSAYIYDYEKMGKKILKNELFESIVTSFFLALFIHYLISSNILFSYKIFYFTLENLIIDSLNEILRLQPLYANYKVCKKRITHIYNLDYMNNYNILNINKICFKNINFKYNDKPILKNISFDINKNDFVLITGSCGCGKTTLFKLLIKEIEYKDKGIFVNGKNINLYSEGEIRNNILYMDNKTKLLNESIEENIFMGSDIDNKILRIAQIKQLLRNNKINLDYLMDNTNNNLSNGQISKVLIARALSSNKKIIIFDEITSSLDIKTERKILSSIKACYKDRTIIIISHRRENLDIFNKIINIDELFCNKNTERRNV